MQKLSNDCQRSLAGSSLSFFFLSVKQGRVRESKRRKHKKGGRLMERKIRDYPHSDLPADFPSTLKSSVVNNTLTASVSNQNVDRVNNIFHFTGLIV